MTELHVVPSGDEPERHTLGNCHCRPRRHHIRRGDDTVDLLHLHRSLDEHELRLATA